MGPWSNLPEVPRADRTVAVLTVSPLEETRSRLRSILKHTNWSFYEVRTRNEALEFLRGHELAVVVCEHDLPDGNWKNLLDAVEGMKHPPLVVVTSTNADDWLWSEVLNLGGYDVLAKPFDKNEVIRIISLAWLHWNDSLHQLQKVVAGLQEGIAPAERVLRATA